MDNDDPTCVVNMIKELRAIPGAYRRDSMATSGLRLSSSSIIPRPFNADESKDVSHKHAPKRQRLEESSSTLNSSTGDNVPGSPWEWRRMRGEVISLRTRLSEQEAALNKLHLIRMELEEVFKKEKKSLEIQGEQDKQVIQQLEARLDVARRAAQEAKEAQTLAEQQLFQMKMKLEQKNVDLFDENAKHREEMRRSMDLAKHPPVAEKPTEDETSTASSLRLAEARIAQLTESLKEARAAQEKSEMLQLEVQSLQSKVKQLESEVASCEEGKLMADRAARASDLERELNTANKLIVNLREAVKGKLLLEEQNANMQQRLCHVEKIEERAADLEAKQLELTARLREYDAIGITGGGSAVKRELQRLQQVVVILTAEEGEHRAKMEAAQRECRNLQWKYNEVKTMTNDLTVAREKLNKLVGRLQRKMMLVTRERDSYRQQLDLYEKEMTVDDKGILSERVPALERAIEGYRELVAKLESDLEAADNCARQGLCTKLREENERLKGELAHRALKGDFNCDARILHVKLNPAAIAEKQAEEKQRALLREVEELRAQLMTGGSTTTPTGSSLHAQEIAELRQSHEIKITRLKNAFKASSSEYRQACYQLFGWRVDRQKEGLYKLSSQYAESSEDFLFFQIGEEGVDLLETEFSARLGTLIEIHLQRQHSVPMFLNAVQSDLFSQQTVTNVTVN